MEKFDVKGILKSYIPSLFELLGNNELDWKVIEKRFEAKFTELEKRFEDTGNKPVMVKASFYFIIAAAVRGEKSAFFILDFINKLFQELTDNLTDLERKLIKKNIFDLLVSMDEKYLNYLGELSILNQIIKSGNFRLLDVEEPLGLKSEGSSIDFKLLNTKSQKETLLEIVNVHLTKDNTKNSYQIQRLLEQKLREKYIKTAKKSNIEFQLASILWGSHEWIRKIIEYYKNENVSLKNIFIPSCFIPFTDSQGNPVYKFGSIETILKSGQDF